MECGPGRAPGGIRPFGRIVCRRSPRQQHLGSRAETHRGVGTEFPGRAGVPLHPLRHTSAMRSLDWFDPYRAPISQISSYENAHRTASILQFGICPESNLPVLPNCSGAGRFEGANGSGGALLTHHLRNMIVGELHTGRQQAGQRLPSIREISREIRVPYRSVVRAYEVLAEGGVVEKRERSGIFVARQERLGGKPLNKTASG